MSGILTVTDARSLALEPGQSTRVWLGVGHSWFGPVQVPMFIARGRRPGPKLVVVAGQHPDEVYGVLGCLDVINETRPDDLRGDLWVLPCLNVQGYVNGQRISQYDHQDMNRVFPGRADGTVTEQVVRQIVDQVLPGADLMLDLHGGSTENGDIAFGRWTDAPGKPSAYPVVLAMDLDFLVTPSDTISGSVGAAMPDAGVPHISIEAGSCIHYPRENAREMVGFVATAMRCLEMSDGPTPAPKALQFRRTVGRRAHTGGAWKTFV